MRPSRRDVLRIGGGILAGLPFAGASTAGGEAVDIDMHGNADGSRVWFEPVGVLVRPGQFSNPSSSPPGPFRASRGLGRYVATYRARSRL